VDSSIVERVQKCIRQVLALKPEQVSPDSRLMTDLGAESLDLVELMYLLEAEFTIKLDQQDMSLSAQLGLTDAELHHSEVLTPRALELLRQRFPKAQDVLKEGVTRRKLAALLTVEEIARSVERKLAKQ
jgi:acyl carrier protein